MWHFIHVLPHCNIGADTIVGQNVMIGPKVRIGRNCRFRVNVSLYEGVELEDDEFCGRLIVWVATCVWRAVDDRLLGWSRT